MTNKLYAGNLNHDTTEDTLRTRFAEYGLIESLKPITERDPGRSRSRALVEMSTGQGARQAMIDLNGKQVDEQEIKVDKANPQHERRQT